MFYLNKRKGTGFNSRSVGTIDPTAGLCSNDEMGSDEETTWKKKNILKVITGRFYDEATNFHEYDRQACATENL
jgi:hypothetical protein